MKKIICVAAVLIVVVTFAACGGRQSHSLEFVVHYIEDWEASSFIATFEEEFFEDNYLIVFRVTQPHTGRCHTISQITSRGNIVLTPSIEGCGFGAMMTHWTHVVELCNSHMPNRFNIVNMLYRRLNDDIDVQIITQAVSRAENALNFVAHYIHADDIDCFIATFDEAFFQENCLIILPFSHPSTVPSYNVFSIMPRREIIFRRAPDGEIDDYNKTHWVVVIELDKSFISTHGTTSFVNTIFPRESVETRHARQSSVEIISQPRTSQ